MTGWFVDFIRLAWGLLYWNTRKSWFQLRRGRARCPCQSPSDSGRGLETQCEACVHWAKASRFQRICPLLVETPQGLRCSVNTAEVRPFWGRAFGYYAAAIAALYLAGVIGVFIFLRTVGYPVSIRHVAWPPSWHRIGQSRGWFFTEKARQAFAAGHTAEAILNLSNAYEVDPGNYAVGVTLAKTLQAGQPELSNRLFDRLFREHPEQREVTAQEWFRAMVSRGDFDAILSLAQGQVLAGGATAPVWMRALVFATRQSHHDAALRAIHDSAAPAAAVWRPLVDTELLLLAGRKAEARVLLDQADWSHVPSYGIYYQVSELTALGDVFAALDRLELAGRQLDPETRVALLLDAYARQGASKSLQRLVDGLLAQKLNSAVIKVLCTQLIRQPDPLILDQFHARFLKEQIPFSTENAGSYFSALCAAGVNGDWPKFRALGTTIVNGGGLTQSFLTGVEAFFRGKSTSTRITSLLPFLPLPLEVNYALLERYPGAPLVYAKPKP